MTTYDIKSHYAHRFTPNNLSIIDQYLAQYAEPEASLLNGVSDELGQLGTLNCVVTVPCYAEPVDNLMRLLDFFSAQQHALLILILNQPDSLNDKQANAAHAANQKWLSHLEKTAAIAFTYNSLCCYKLEQSFVLTIDRFSSKPIPHKQGVGLARKIGGDLASSLAAKGIVSTNWLHTTDADCLLPTDYLSIPLQSNDQTATAAYIYPFTHIDGNQNTVSAQSDDKLSTATALYEQKLKHYRDGLERAGSSYAYHSIGSCLCVNLNAYASVRGFPKRSAGEDFYLLNKLRKQGAIEQLSSSPIRIDARISARTPFGTGSAVSDILEYAEISQAKIFYPTEVFDALSVFLRWQETLKNLERQSLQDWRISLTTFCQDQHDLLHATGITPENIVTASSSIGFDTAITHLKSQQLTPLTAAHHLFCWFDAFKTLRWIHALQKTAGMDFVVQSDCCRAISSRQI